MNPWERDIPVLVPALFLPLPGALPPASRLSTFASISHHPLHPATRSGPHKVRLLSPFRFVLFFRVDREPLTGNFGFSDQTRSPFLRPSVPQNTSGIHRDRYPRIILDHRPGAIAVFRPNLVSLTQPSSHSRTRHPPFPLTTTSKLIRMSVQDSPHLPLSSRPIFSPELVQNTSEPQPSPPGPLPLFPGHPRSPPFLNRCLRHVIVPIHTKRAVRKVTACVWRRRPHRRPSKPSPVRPDGLYHLQCAH